MMRLLSFCSFWASVVFGVLTMRTPENAVAAQSMGTWLTIAFLIGAFAPKGLQKIAELKLGVDCKEKETTETVTHDSKTKTTTQERP